jgi:GAF domain-containing protein
MSCARRRLGRDRRGRSFHRARRLIGSDGIALVLAEDGLCHYVEEDAVGPLWKGRKFAMTECISGWAMIHNTTAVIPDISKDDRIPHHLYAETFVKSLVMTPIGIGQPVGALGAYWATAYEPTDYEIATVTTLARATATALENAARSRRPKESSTSAGASIAIIWLSTGARRMGRKCGLPRSRALGHGCCVD